jgi:hypothetical protein
MRRIGLYSATAGLAETMLKHIKAYCRLPILIELFPEIFIDPGKNDSNYEISNANMLTIVRKGDPSELPQEAQVEAYGVGANIVGRHFDNHFYDDLVTKDNVTSPTQIDKILEWYEYVQSILSPDGVETMVGTRYHYSDLYGWVIENGIYRKRVFVRAVEENDKPIYTYFNKDRIQRYKKRMRPYIFSCQFNNNPVAKEDQLFPPPQPVYTDLPNDLVCYVVLDPAATIQAYSDESAFAVGGWHKPSSTLFVLESFGVKKPGNELAQILIKLQLKYKPRTIGIEFGLQEHLRYIIDNEVSKYQEAVKQKLNLNIFPIPLTKQSKYERINWTLGSLVRGGQVKINPALKGLMQQMENLTPNYKGKDDQVDAVSMLPLLIADFGFKFNMEKHYEYKPSEGYIINRLFPKLNKGGRNSILL